jgi:hypothetical protein
MNTEFAIDNNGNEKEIWKKIIINPALNFHFTRMEALPEEKKPS